MKPGTELPYSLDIHPTNERLMLHDNQKHRTVAVFYDGDLAAHKVLHACNAHERLIAALKALDERATIANRNSAKPDRALDQQIFAARALLKECEE